MTERRAYTITELGEYARKIKKQEKEEREARGYARRCEDCIELFPDGKFQGYPYEITFDRLKTPAEIVAWLQHLREKNWFTPQVEYDFLTFALKRIPRRSM